MAPRNGRTSETPEAGETWASGGVAVGELDEFGVLAFHRRLASAPPDMDCDFCRVVWGETVRGR